MTLPVIVVGITFLLSGCSCSGEVGGRDAGAPRRDAPSGRDAGPLPDGATPDGATPDSAGLDASIPRARAHDLDRDGTNETDLRIDPCPMDAARLCLIAETDARSSAVALPEGAKPAAGGSATVIGRPIRVIGDHAGGTLSEVSTLFQLSRGAHDSPALAVIDVEAESIVATTSAPASIAAFSQYALTSFTDFARAPDGRLHPFLAPGYGDSNDVTWGYACIFHAAAAASARCGPGFVEASTIPGAPAWFREVGGYLQDLDADGWDDVNLIYHQTVLSFSSQTGAALVSTTYDVAAAEEPGSPPLFHSGRNYGTHSSFTGPDRLLRNVMVAGAPVGSFTDYNCNVSRFVAVLESTAGAPTSRTMRWVDYFGFGSSIFIRYDPAYADDPASDLARLGNFMDGCIHRFGDSRTTIDGVDAVIFDYFVADGPVDACLDEQYQLYLPPAWTEEKARIWYECFARNVASTGIWGMQARRVTDEASITGGQRVYVWGQSDRLLPTGEIVYLVESLPPRTRWDLADTVPTQLNVYALVAGLFVSRGTFPIAARPVIVSVPAEGPIGIGSFTGLAELELADRDGDGQLDVHLDGDAWVGWDAATSTFVVK